MVSMAPSSSGREYRTTDCRPWIPDFIQLSEPDWVWEKQEIRVVEIGIDLMCEEIIIEEGERRIGKQRLERRQVRRIGERRAEE